MLSTFVPNALVHLVFFCTLVAATTPSYNFPVYRRAPPTLQTASWIWTSDTTTGSAPAAPAETCAFRKTYTTPSGDTARSATVLATVDNSFALYLNGQLIGSSFNWMNASLFEIANIDPYENVFAISATNWPLGGSPNSSAGLLANIDIKMDSGLEVNLVSDSSWRANRQPPDGFELPSTDDSSGGWTTPTVIGPYGATRPWFSAVSILPPVAVAYTATAMSSSTSATGSSTASSTPTSTGTGTRTNKPPIGAIVGGAVGGVALAAIVVFSSFCLRRKSRAHVRTMDLLALDSPPGNKDNENPQPLDIRQSRIDPYFTCVDQATPGSAGSPMLASSSNQNTHVFSRNPRPLTVHQTQERDRRGKINDSRRMPVHTSPPPVYSDL